MTFYDLKTAPEVSLLRTRRFKMVIRKGKPFGRLLSRFKVVNGVKYQLHATKGWRKV